MNDNELLAAYQQELAYIRRLGAEFATRHPKIAGHLAANTQTVEDPHVARLIEALALGNARIRRKLTDDFAELNDALLTILYPDYLAPTPAMTVIQFAADVEKLRNKKIIPAHSLVTTDSCYGEQCYFSTCYPVELLPVSVEQAYLTTSSSPIPNASLVPDTGAVLYIKLICNAELSIFKQLELNELKFFINAQPQQAYAMYELLFNNIVNMALADSPDDKNPVILDKTCLQPVGFAEAEGLLPYSKRTFIGYRLLKEFFTLPEKFLFFKLSNLNEYIKQKQLVLGNSLYLYFYLKQSNLNLEKNVNKDFFSLGCTPIVNLFSAIAEPFELTHTQSEYHLIPDIRRLPQATEVYTVKRVVATNDAGRQIEYRPFYGTKDGQAKQFYYASRQHAQQNAERLDQGTEIFLSFSDLSFNPAVNEKWIVSAEILCTNRDLPNQLPFGGAGPHLKLLGNNANVIKTINCLIPITPAKRPSLRNSARWRTIAHLALNQISLSNDKENLAALRTLLQLYAVEGHEHSHLLEGLLAMQCKPAIARNSHHYRGNTFWQGTTIHLQVDEAKFTGTSLYLFSCVLERFFALYTGINSFTELVVLSQQRGKVYSWLPRAGSEVLI